MMELSKSLSFKTFSSVLLYLLFGLGWVWQVRRLVLVPFGGSSYRGRVFFFALSPFFYLSSFLNITLYFFSPFSPLLKDYLQV